jgi:hypothetical protein
MATLMRVGDRLSETRHARFVGREEEAALFRQLLRAEPLPLQVLYVYGPAGIGKSTLAHEFLYLCREAGVGSVYLDARDVEASPHGLCSALRQAAGIDPGERLPDELWTDGRRRVLIVDTYENLAPLDGWMRDILLPRLPESVLTVLCGRKPPSRLWRTDPGWQSLLKALPLRNLAPNEGQTYLANRAVPADQHRAVLEFTHGHPLALSLVADAFAQRGAFHFSPEAAPDIVSALVPSFMEAVPDRPHREALEVCAQARNTTEGLLAATIEAPDPHALFEWLQSLSFVEVGRAGLLPHDAAREALLANLRWRDPEWHLQLHKRARTYYGARVQQTTGFEQQQVLFDYVFLHRDNPLMRPYIDWQETGVSMPDTLRPGDERALHDMVRQHEGPESARWVDYWIEQAPAAFVVYRDADREPAGFMAALALDDLTDEQRDLDPAVRSAWRYLSGCAPLRPGERATMFRFWMDRTTYQAVSAVQSLIFGRAVQHYLTTPGLAFSFFPAADADFWAPMFTHVDLPRVPQADFCIGGRHFGVFGHDWRARPSMAWLTLLGERELAVTPQAPRTISSVVLSEAEFGAAVRDALRQLHRPDLLRGNPLLRSRLIVQQAGCPVGDAQRLEALRSQVFDAAAGLKLSARDARLWAALDQTYFHPAASQEQAAELLDLPFSTYRRYLKAGIARVTDTLWQRELGVSEQ